MMALNEFIGKYEVLVRMEVNNSQFVVYANTVENQIHLLDLDISGTRSVTNNIDFEFLNDVMRELPYDFKQGFAKSMADIRYFWIGTDGVATEFIYETEDMMFMNPSGYKKMIIPVLRKYIVELDK